MYDLRCYLYGGCFWKQEELVKLCRETNVVRTKSGIMFPILSEKMFISFKWETVHSSKQMLWSSLLAILMRGTASTGTRKSLRRQIFLQAMFPDRWSWHQSPLCFFLHPSRDSDWRPSAYEPNLQPPESRYRASSIYQVCKGLRERHLHRCAQIPI